MKWVVLAIVLLIVPYTVVTLRYRKPGPAFQPYEDMKNRANVSRLLAAGYQRIPIHANRPADPMPAAATAAIATVAGGVPSDLRSTLVEPPLLPLEISSVVASPTASTLQPYVVQLVCTLPDDKQLFAGAELYVRDETLVIVPTFEPVRGDLQTRSRDAAVALTIPAGALKPGRYTVTAAADRASRTWTLEVK